MDEHPKVNPSKGTGLLASICISLLGKNKGFNMSSSEATKTSSFQQMEVDHGTP